MSEFRPIHSTFLVSVVGLVLGFAVIGVREIYETATRPVITGKDIVDAEQAARQKREKLAADMIRMGAVDWMLSCAYEHGLNDETIEAVEEDCNIDWQLGPMEEEPHA